LGIDQLAAVGILQGTGDGRYQPDALSRYLRSVQSNQSGVATIVICTNRPARAVRTIDVVHGQSGGTVPIVVVDDGVQSSELLQEHGMQLQVRVVRPPMRGLSVARNAGWRAATTPWVIYLDDDVVPEPGWLPALLAALRHHPEVEIVSCDVRAPTRRGADALAVTEHRVREETRLQGRWLRPWMIGFTLCTAFRRTTLERLGGFDERLGPGTPFPSAEDMDLNYRFLRAGGVAFAASRPQAVHEQWRVADELPEHFRGYMVGWNGFAIKHLRQGDVWGGVWLWSLGLVDLLRMTASAARRRSGIRWRVAHAKGRGLLQGTAAAARQRW
jgi:GT2 family glycosyltransferase